MRAQFIRGIHNSDIRESLLLQKDLTFEIAIEKALAFEASKIDNDTFRNISSSQPSTNADINKLTHRLSRNYTTRQEQFSSNSSQKFKQSAHNQRENRDQHRSHVQLAALGLENVCLRCGKSNHQFNECRLHRSQVRCRDCNKQGHVPKVCIKTLLSKQKNSVKNIQSNLTNQSDESDDDDFYGVGTVLNIYDTNFSTTEKFITTVLINGQPLKFEVDSGSAHTLIPKADFDRLNLSADSLKRTNVKFRSYTGEIFSPLGIASVQVEINKHSAVEQLFVVPDQFTPLLGRTWIRRFNIDLSTIDHSSQKSYHINTINDTVEDLISKIESNYSDILTPTIGCIPNISTNLQLRSQAKPIFLKPRPLPFALRDQVGKELDRLEKDNIITKIDLSDWGSPLVVVPKPDGSLRLCADYKPTVNPQLYDAHYPIPKIEENLHKLRNASYFCTLDLFKAYLHVPVDDESAHVQAISTHKGTYKVNRLSFGIKTAPSIFNQIIDQLLGDLPGVSTYFDDIIVYGSTLQECYNNLCSCLERLKTNNLHLNHKKCLFFRQSITYLGFVVEHNKVSKSPAKVASILSAEPPKSVDDVRRFLGLVTYYSKFIPSASTLTYPLRQLLIKNRKFLWTKNCAVAFDKIKQEIASDRVLVPYDPNLPLSLACDASPFGVAGVLSHSINGTERPIAFVSRSLTKAESQYSQLDREALAIVFSVNKFFPYLFARKFDLITDNQPLTRIFHPKNVPPMSAGRLLRYAVFLRGFEYTIRHRKATEHTNVDYLSRSTTAEINKGIDTTINKEVEELEHLSIMHISSIDISSESIAKETTHDASMQPILQQLKKGTNDPIYSLNQGVVFRGERVYIPASLRPQVLQELHSTHVGIVRMKRLARRYCYWPGIDQDIEHNVRSCVSCSVNQKQPIRITHSWETPDSNFERVHMDYAGPFNGHHFLVLVDAKSKWPEVKITRSDPTSAITIEFLLEIFSSHGYPTVLVSDNATIFTSQEFQHFCYENGITQKFSAPGHPSTNGLAERYVQTIKSALKRNLEDQQIPSTRVLIQKVRDILFRYRATPLQCGSSPAELYLNRKIRTRLDVLRPITKTTNNQSRNTKVKRSFCQGDRVLVRVGQLWQFGKILNRLGALHYKVRLDSGYISKRHINQLKKTEVPEEKKEETIDDTKDISGKHLKPIVKIKNNLENSEIIYLPRQGQSLNPPHQVDQQTFPLPEDQPRRSERQRKPPKRFSP